MSEFHPYLDEKFILIDCILAGNEKLKNLLLRFLLVFNLFESEFFSTPRWVEENGKKRKKVLSVKDRRILIQDHINEKQIWNIDFYSKFREHFREAYIDSNGSWNMRGRLLEVSKKNPEGYSVDEFDELKKFLTADPRLTKRESLKTSLKLCYLFRNNLFHGGKDLRVLEKHIEDFEIILDFMIQVIKLLDKSGFNKA